MNSSSPNSPQSSPETATPTAAPAETQAPPSELRQFAELFEEQPKPQGNGSASETAPAGLPAEKQTQGKPKNLAELAETLKLKPEDLYDLDVPMSNGKPVKLGALKDAAARQEEFSVRELQFEESRVKRESELLRSLSELREVVSMLPPAAVKPEVIDAVRRKHEATVKAERARTLEVIPEWNDEAKRTADIAGMIEHLQAYGFAPNTLESIVDHRQVRYVRENYLREKRLKAALAQVSAVKSSTPAPSRTSGTVPKKPPRETPRHYHDARAEFAKIFQT